MNTMQPGDLVKLSKHGRRQGYWRLTHRQGILTEIDGAKYHVYWIDLNREERHQSLTVFSRQELMRIQ